MNVIVLDFGIVITEVVSLPLQFSSPLMATVMELNVSSHSLFWGNNMTAAPRKDALMGIVGAQLQPTLTLIKNMDSVLAEVRDFIPHHISKKRYFITIFSFLKPDIRLRNLKKQVQLTVEVPQMTVDSVLQTLQ